MFHAKVKQKNLFNITLGIREVRVKQISRTKSERLLPGKHVYVCAPAHLHIQYVLLGKPGENRKLGIFMRGLDGNM